MAEETKVQTPPGTSTTVTVKTVADTAEETKPYRLKAGKKHTHNGVAARPGDTVEFNVRQAHAFRDKFDAVGEGFRFGPAVDDSAHETNTEKLRGEGSPEPVDPHKTKR